MERISAAIDEDERVARAVEGIRKPYYFDFIDDAARPFVELTVDPARVLRRVAADRKILDEHESYSGYGEHCQTCHRLDDLAGDPWPCTTLRLLAEAYRVDPGQ